MTDPVLTVLTQIEIDLQALVVPGPTAPPPAIPQSTDPGYAAWADENNIQAYATGSGAPTGDLNSVKGLLTGLYQIDFVKKIGSTTLPPLITEVRNILIDIADKLGPTGPLGSVSNMQSGVAGLKTFLNAIQQLPGSPEALTSVSEILTQISGLLSDIPSTRNELYMIAQQLRAFSDVFATA